MYSKFDKIFYKEEEAVEIEISCEGNEGEEVAESGTIELDWNEIDESATGPSSNADWELVNKDNTTAHKESNYNEEETLLYNHEFRQLLVNDLEELEFFLRQRLSELSQKDAATFSMYIEAT